jgi:hypothetical protein
MHGTECINRRGGQAVHLEFDTRAHGEVLEDDLVKVVGLMVSRGRRRRCPTGITTGIVTSVAATAIATTSL